MGGGIVSTDTLNSGAIIDNIEDYNSKSMGILLFVIVFLCIRRRGGYKYDI